MPAAGSFAIADDRERNRLSDDYRKRYVSHGMGEGVKFMRTNDQLEATVFVIFGGAGDLTWR
jgi:hypothetical protein